MLKLPFDKIYVLHLAECDYRYYRIMTELEKIGIRDQVEIWWTCKRFEKENNKIKDTFLSLRTDFYDEVDRYPSVFNCALEHYTIIKQAYLRGFENIMIMEDDLYFFNKINLENIFNNLPKDADIIKYYSIVWDEAINMEEEYNQILNNFYDFFIKKLKNNVNETFFKVNNIETHFAGCYSLNRKGMKYIINQHEKNGLQISDITLQCNNNMVNIYTLNILKNDFINPFMSDNVKSDINTVD